MTDVYLKCPGTVTVDQYDMVACPSGWVTQTLEELAADVPSLYSPLTVADFEYYWGVILILFVSAFGFKIMRRVMGF